MFLFADSSIAYFTSASFLPLLKCRIAAATHAVASVILLIRVACLLSSSLPAYYSTVPLTYVRTCCRTAPLSITGLLLVRVADLPSFSSLAYCSYVPLAYPHFHYTTFGGGGVAWRGVVAHEGLTNRFCAPLDQNFRQATLIFPLTIAPYPFVLGNNAGSSPAPPSSSASTLRPASAPPPPSAPREEYSARFPWGAPSRFRVAMAANDPRVPRTVYSSWHHRPHSGRQGRRRPLPGKHPTSQGIPCSLTNST